MRSPFKLKSQGSSFKTMGSSPLMKKKPPVDPATLDSSKLGGFGEAEMMKSESKLDKDAFEHMFNKDAPLKQKDFNFTGTKASTTPKYNIKKKGNFNFTGESKSTTPKYSTTKAAKTQNFRNEANKIKTVSSQTNKGNKVINARRPGQELTDKLMKAVNKNIAPKVKKKIVHKGAVNIAKNVGRKLAKFASRRLGPIGVALTAYDIASRLPAAAKATDKALRKEAKTGSTVGKPKY